MSNWRRAPFRSWCGRGARLVQLRLRRGTQAGDDPALRDLHARDALVDREAVIDDGLVLTVDTQGSGGVIAWKARAHAGLVDVERIGHYDPEEFWEPVAARPGSGIVLNPDDFYILASKETVSIPPDHAAEMRPYDTRVGEFRVHYAGFFDPGFGYGAGSRAVLEVRAHDVPFVVGGRPAGRQVDLRADACGPGQDLRRRDRLHLPGAGPAARQAFPPAGQRRIGSGKNRPAARLSGGLGNERETMAMSERTIFPVTAETAGSAHIDAAAYEEMYRRSVEDPEGFWAEQARRLDWIRPFSKVKDVSWARDDLHIRWFEDGTLNACANCVDRHLADRADQVGDHLGGRRPGRGFGPHHLPRAARGGSRKFANVPALAWARKASGDRVTIYLPMIPEAAYRDAGLRADRRDPFRGVRRLLAGRAGRPHHRLRFDARHHRRRGPARRPQGPAQGQHRRRARVKCPDCIRPCIVVQAHRRRDRLGGRPRRLVPGG